MNRLSIGAAWEETLAFVKREGTLLFPVALLFLALPGVVLQLLLPDSMHQTEPMKEISATSQLPPQFLLGMGVVILMAMLGALARSEEHTSELQPLMRIPYAVFCLKK